MIVEVTWEDAHFAAGTFTREQAELDDFYICKTVGWLIKRDKRHIRVAMEQINDGRFRDLMVIPMALVKKVRRLR